MFTRLTVTCGYLASNALTTSLYAVDPFEYSPGMNDQTVSVTFVLGTGPSRPVLLAGALLPPQAAASSARQEIAARARGARLRRMLRNMIVLSRHQLRMAADSFSVTCSRLAPSFWRRVRATAASIWAVTG